MTKRNRVLKQMFDVKPVKSDGSLNLEKIEGIKRIVTFEKGKRYTSREAKNLRLADVVMPKTRSVETPRRGVSQAHNIETQNFASLCEEISFQPKPGALDPYFQISSKSYRPKIKEETQFTPALETFPEKIKESETEAPKTRKRIRKFSLRKKIKSLKSLSKKLVPDLSRLKIQEDAFSQKISTVPRFSYGFSFAGILLLFSFSIFALSYVQKALDMKTTLVATTDMALGQFAEAKDNLSNSRFDEAAVDFSESHQILSDASRDIARMGGNFSEILRFIPGISKLASANYVISAGEHLSLAGKNISEAAKPLEFLGNPLDSQNDQISLTDLFLTLRSGIQNASEELGEAESDIGKVNPDDLPEDVRSQFAELEQKLPIVNENLEDFLDYSEIFLDVLGYNGPRKYLFLFENNQEMRATGGFIGSYGILDISNGRLKKLYVDDIYNPDGQLKARVIPPEPIQKMSAVWTMHDANWFPDFPASAEKVAWFYEKTGGPTVDGVIAVTPELLQDFLEITGPIDMPEYETTVDADNFIEKTQYEVEIDYDREENRPKKFIADLTPKILDEVMSERGIVPMMRTLKAFDSALSKKHLLLYSRNYNIQKLISDQKWSGEILNTDKNYLAVINTNINGYKTDGVIDETIDHQSDIQPDGSIIDTVSVTRKHNGGNEEYDWWNKVNGNWMRVYVPKNAKLLEVDGQTREFVPPALDYDSLGFKRDPQLESLDDTARVDEESGTKIYEENNKTVFANWVYVSPGEKATITYKYVLPFKLRFDALHHPADSFSILYQKQSGSVGSKLVSEIKLPETMRTIWRWPDDLKQNGIALKMETILDTDRFVGLAVEKQ